MDFKSLWLVQPLNLTISDRTYNQGQIWLVRRQDFHSFLNLWYGRHLRPGGTVSQIFGAENLKDVLPKLVDTLKLGHRIVQISEKSCIMIVYTRHNDWRQDIKENIWNELPPTSLTRCIGFVKHILFYSFVAMKSVHIVFLLSIARLMRLNHTEFHG